MVFSVNDYLELCKTFLYESSIFASESKLGCLNIVEHKLLCLVKGYILNK